MIIRLRYALMLACGRAAPWLPFTYLPCLIDPHPYTLELGCRTSPVHQKAGRYRCDERRSILKILTSNAHHLTTASQPGSMETDLESVQWLIAVLSNANLSEPDNFWNKQLLRHPFGEKLMAANWVLRPPRNDGRWWCGGVVVWGSGSGKLTEKGRTKSKGPSGYLDNAQADTGNHPRSSRHIILVKAPIKLPYHPSITT